MSERKALFVFGRKRKPDYVRGFRETVDGVPKIRVQWSRRSSTESFDDTRKGLAEAKAFAEGVHESLQTRAPAEIAPLTLRELVDKHIAAKDSEWRPNTLRLLRGRWGKLELSVGRSTPAHLITRETLDDLKRKLLETHSPNQVRLAIKAVTSVFRWGVDRDLVPPTKVVTYTAKFSKDVERSAPKMAEFSADERLKVIAQLDPRDSRQWRAWVLVTLLAYCGPRQNAARHLEWRDIDFDGGLIIWRPELDKMAGERSQPMPQPVRDALWVAYGWRQTQGYIGRFVFYGVQQRGRDKDQPWTYQAFCKALHDAERRAGMTPIKWRGAHGFRRGIAGDVHAKTGSSKKAAEWIGDKSVKVVERHYLLEREAEQRKTAEMVGGEDATQAKSNATKRNGPADEGEAESLNPFIQGSSVQ